MKRDREKVLKSGCIFRVREIVLNKQVCFSTLFTGSVKRNDEEFSNILKGFLKLF